MKKSIIFIHGFRGSSLGMEQVANCFDNKKYNIYVPDMPPAGDESLPEYSPRFYARFLARYIKNNEIEKPILVGHSMGSIIAAIMAERYSDLINKKLVLMSPISARTSKFFRMLTPLSVLLSNRVISQITTRFLLIPKDKSLLKKTILLVEHCGANYVSRFDVFKAAKFSTEYSISDFSFEKEVCIIAGDKDRLMPHKKTDILASELNTKPIYIKNAGHLINYETPEQVAKYIKKFLKT
ncbi:alpha/beta hydrolase [Candidatus Saccharibacteria bacterium]|nr:alpha/beta hydrolase [Candidatus Saccharibacteria bacterium]